MTNRRNRWLVVGAFVGTLCLAGLLQTSAIAQNKKAPFELKKGDRIAWVGSSSTNIGVWPKTMEFLLRTRHPELELSFKKFSTGGGTFATGVQNLDKWLDDFKPTVVFLNYGSNDAGAGEKGLPAMKANIVKCVEKIEARKARVIFTTFQGADPRKSGEEPAAKRKLYAGALVDFCKEKNWPFVNVYPRIQYLQDEMQRIDEKYTILRDKIHLTDPAYIAWGFYLYQGMKLKDEECELVVFPGQFVKGFGSSVPGGLGGVSETKSGDQIRFKRQDKTLPILPPGPLPPRKLVPLEELSSYVLNIGGLDMQAKYEILCEDKSLGVVTGKDLRIGVNINKLILDNNVTPPWDELARNIWAGKDLDKIGKTEWNWRVVKKMPNN
jgi:lysophospholipase L1-like esterase